MLLLRTGAPFMYKIKGDDMIVVTLGYKSYVMSNKDAVALAEILEKAEMYEQKWVSQENRTEGGSDHTYHVFENETSVDMKLISNDLYLMAKLAGKPVVK